MSFLSPVVRRKVVAHCRSVHFAALSAPAKQWVRQSSAVAAFRPSLVRSLPRTPPPSPPPQPPTSSHPSSASPSSHVDPDSTSTAPSRKPEDLYPESFPIDEKDLVNPSGRVYAVRRPPDEDDGESKRSLQEQSTLRESLFVPLAEARDPPLLGALVFFVLGGGLIYCGAAAYSVKSTETAARKIEDGKGGGSIFGDFSSFFGGSGNGAKNRALSVDERQLRAAQKQELAQKMGRGLHRLLKRCDQLGIPQEGRKTIARMYTWVAESYLHLRDDKAALVPIFAINSVIFLGWRLSMLPSLRSSLQVFMRRNFLHAPASGRTYTMLTSTFSHRGGLHFFFNHYAMWSFGAASLATFSITSSDYTPQASLTPHVFAFFCTAGIASALSSHLLTALSFRFVAARRGLAAAKMSIGRMGSLGASGSAYAMVVMTALSFPDNAVALIFLPMVPISIGYGVAGMVAFDVIGLLFRLRLFDHAAHLGGAAFGYFYYYYGSHSWETVKAQIRTAKAKHLRTG